MENMSRARAALIMVDNVVKKIKEEVYIIVRKGETFPARSLPFVPSSRAAEFRNFPTRNPDRATRITRKKIYVYAYA